MAEKLESPSCGVDLHRQRTKVDRLQVGIQPSMKNREKKRKMNKKCMKNEMKQENELGKMDCLDTDEGRLVWAKLGKFPPWPAIIVSGLRINHENAPLGSHWIFWFGDHKVSVLKNHFLIPFSENFNSLYHNGRNKKLFQKAVDEVLNVCIERCNLTISGPVRILKWAKQNLAKHSSSSNAGVVSEAVLAQCKELAGQQKPVDSPVDDNDDDSDDDNDWCADKARRDRKVDLVRRKKLDMRDFCVCCGDQSLLSEHPHFEVAVCSSCQVHMKEVCLLMGEDGHSHYCTICFDGGNLILCDADDCFHSCCKECSVLFSKNASWAASLKNENWVCFRCSYSQAPPGSCLLNPATDYQKRLERMFTSLSPFAVPYLSVKKVNLKAGLRVLSVHDGISAARCALETMAIQLERYCSCEQSSMLSILSQTHHPGNLQFSKIQSLTGKAIEALFPLHLVMGKANTCDLKNDAQFYVTFFEFVRILRETGHRNNQPFFWLYHSPAAEMSASCRKVVNRHLGLDAALVEIYDGCRYYFWGNLPGLHSIDDWRLYSKQLSVKEGDNVLDLERMLGLPEHYSDISDIAVGPRYLMLKNTLSVYAYRHLFSFLSQ